MTGQPPQQLDEQQPQPELSDAHSVSSTPANKTEDEHGAQANAPGALEYGKSGGEPTGEVGESVEGPTTERDGGDEDGERSSKVEGKDVEVTDVDADTDNNQEAEGAENEEEEEEEEEEDDEEEDDDDEDDEEEEEEEEDEEPLLKSVRLTQHLGAVYRNGDATSACLVAGDKMVWSIRHSHIHELY